MPKRPNIAVRKYKSIFMVCTSNFVYTTASCIFPAGKWADIALVSCSCATSGRLNLYPRGPTANGTNANTDMVANHGQSVPQTESKNPDSSSTPNTINDDLEIRVRIYVADRVS